MKALLIADEKKSVERIKNLLEKQGYDTIIYSVFIKALDNLEEIAPHLIIINACEFPRQWKMLCQYIKSFNSFKSQIILLTDSTFSSEEKNKALYLGVNNFFDFSLSDETFNNLLGKENKVLQIQSVFINPHTFALVTGKSFLKNNELIFDSDNASSISSISQGEKITLYLNSNNQFSCQNALVKNINSSQIKFSLEEVL